MATFVKGKVFEPKALVDYAEGSVVSRELEHNEAGSITVFSFDKGQELSEHQAPFDALIQVIDGEMTFVLEDETLHLQTGEALVIPAGARNDTVRRQDRLMDEERALELLRESEYGVLSMQDVDGSGYGVPLNYVWDGDHSIYIHCAPDGHKLRALEQHPQVSFCIIGRVHLLPRNFTTEYESVILRGEAHIHLSEEEMMRALHLLVDKLSPDFKEIGYKYSEKSFHRVNIIRVDFTEFSGKRKYVAKAD